MKEFLLFFIIWTVLLVLGLVLALVLYAKVERKRTRELEEAANKPKPDAKLIHFHKVK